MVRRRVYGEGSERGALAKDERCLRLALGTLAHHNTPTAPQGYRTWKAHQKVFKKRCAEEDGAMVCTTYVATADEFRNRSFEEFLNLPEYVGGTTHTP